MLLLNIAMYVHMNVVFVVVFSQSGAHVPRKPTPGGRRTGTP